MASRIVPNSESEATSFDNTLKSARSTLMFSDIVSLAVDSFCANKTRFLLTMLGMIIGSASIILVVTVGMTGKQYALDTISSIGQNMVEMQYSGGSIIGPDNTTTPDFMTREDMQAVIDTVPGIVAYSPMLETHDPVSIGGGVTQETMMLGVSPQYKTVRGLVVLAGRFFDDQDASEHAKVIVMNLPLAVQLYGSAQAAVDKSISIKGIPLTVIGVFKESIDTYGQSEINDHTILIPYEVARYFYGSDNLKEIFFRMADSSMVEPGAEKITALIKSRHRPSSIYHAMTMTDILDTMSKIANYLTWVLILAAAITLTVSGVGIANSMLASVQARTREIGIRKAMGATRREIFLQFLTEAVFLSLAGGVIGTLIGLGIPLSIGLLTPYKIPIGWPSAPIALLTSVVVGILSGTIPANSAARLDPVETLKYE